MATVLKDRNRGKRGFALLATVLLAVALLLFASLALTSDVAYADTPQNQQNYSEENGEPGYEVYTFNNQDLIDAQTNQSGVYGTYIPDNEVPLSGSIEPDTTAHSDKGSGSFYNTILAALAAVSMLLMLLALSRRKTEDFRVIVVRTIAVAFGLVTITTWSLIDRLQVPALVFNDATLLISVLFAIYVLVAIVSYVYESRLNKVQRSD